MKTDVLCRLLAGASGWHWWLFVLAAVEYHEVTSSQLWVLCSLTARKEFR